jgi:hypothetical protein
MGKLKQIQSAEQFEALKQELRQRRNLAFTVSSHSMEPFLSVGDQFHVEDWVSPQQGEFLVFWSTRQLVVHRLKYIQKNLLDGEIEYIMGPADSKMGEDLPIRAHQVLGRVPKMRYSRPRMLKFKIFFWLQKLLRKLN